MRLMHVQTVLKLELIIEGKRVCETPILHWRQSLSYYALSGAFIDSWTRVAITAQTLLYP